MDLAEFWDLVERSGEKEPDPDERAAWLTEQLAALSPAEIVDFRKHLDSLHHLADTWNMWGAADLICGGANDDAFWYFQLWLIGLGRETFERALANPDSLADVPLVREIADSDDGDDFGWPDWEQLDYVADDAYEELTGKDLDETVGDGSPGLTDEEFDLDDQAEQERRYPRLFEMFSEEDDS